MAPTDASAASRRATVAVVGGGQSGLSAGYHLKRHGFASALDDLPRDDRTFVVLDAEPAPGGAWRHRWESLTMATVNGLFALPGPVQRGCPPRGAPQARRSPPRSRAASPCRATSPTSRLTLACPSRGR